ncbi:unnamed protein product [[Candida] boidinii]|nr:unnamed protein product [[Candida] boidinii]
MRKHNINAVLITNDKNNNEKAKNEGIISMPLKEYISILPNSNELEDMLPSTEVFSNSLQEIKYPEYYTTARLMGGIKNGTLYQGNINISSYNFLEGSISVPSFPKPLLIMGRENLNRAFNGDNVVVELLPKDKWKRPSTEYLDEEVISKTQFGDNEDENLVISDQDRRALAKEAVKVQGQNTSEEEKTVPTGKVVDHYQKLE